MEDKTKAPVPQGDDQNQKGNQSYPAVGDAPAPAQDDVTTKGNQSYPAEGK